MTINIIVCDSVSIYLYSMCMIVFVYNINNMYIIMI